MMIINVFYIKQYMLFKRYMIKKLLNILNIYILVCFIGSCQSTNIVVRHIEQTSIVDNIQNATVAIVGISRDLDIFPYCTGVWIHDNMILTAAHCIAYKRSVITNTPMEKLDDCVGDRVIYTTKGEVHLGEQEFLSIKIVHSGIVVAYDQKNDLAAIKTEDNPPKHYNAIINKNEIITIGPDIIHSVGHPGGFWYTYLKGNISAKRHNYRQFSPGTTDLLQLSLPGYQGNSGGGVFNSKGNLIGIISSAVIKMPATMFAIDHDVIVSFLEKHHIF